MQQVSSFLIGCILYGMGKHACMYETLEMAVTIPYLDLLQFFFVIGSSCPFFLGGWEVHKVRLGTFSGTV